jgi:hypothetical protein
VGTQGYPFLTPNNPNWVEFNRFKEDLANVVKTKLGVDIGNTSLY